MQNSYWSVKRNGEYRCKGKVSFSAIHIVLGKEICYNHVGMNTRHETGKILVAMGLDTLSRREMLSGIFRFVNSHARWSILFRQTDALDAHTITQACADGVCGILAAELADVAAYRALRESGVMALVQRKPGFADEGIGKGTDGGMVAWVETDNLDVGRCAARYLASVGKFASFAFVPAESRNAVWSRQREEGFERELAERGIASSIFDGGHLADWLGSLELPAAVFCAYDQGALRVLDASTRLRLKVPSHLAILGVDDDTLLCANANVSLSSIAIDHEAFGYDMMADLAATLRGDGRRKKHTVGRIALKNVRVVERESTRPPVPAAVLIRRALDCISQSATHGLDVEGLARRMAVSERLLYLRFQELRHTTPGRAIMEARLKAVEARLRQGRESIGAISAACGFASPKQLAHAFKRHHGMSMRAFRAVSHGITRKTIASR